MLAPATGKPIFGKNGMVKQTARQEAALGGSGERDPSERDAVRVIGTGGDPRRIGHFEAVDP